MPTGRYTPHIRPDGSQVNGHREQAFDKYGLPPRDHCGERVRPDRPFRRLRSRDRATPWHFTPLLERYRVDRRAPPEGGSHTWSAPPARPTASPTAESPGSSVGAPSFVPPRARSDRRRGTDLRPPFMRREVFRLRSDAPCCSPLAQLGAPSTRLTRRPSGRKPSFPFTACTRCRSWSERPVAPL